jgi:hypothetical protein
VARLSALSTSPNSQVSLIARMSSTGKCGRGGGTSPGSTFRLAQSGASAGRRQGDRGAREWRWAVLQLERAARGVAEDDSDWAAAVRRADEGRNHVYATARASLTVSSGDVAQGRSGQRTCITVAAWRAGTSTVITPTSHDIEREIELSRATED